MYYKYEHKGVGAPVWQRNCFLYCRRYFVGKLVFFCSMQNSTYKTARTVTSFGFSHGSLNNLASLYTYP